MIPGAFYGKVSICHGKRRKGIRHGFAEVGFGSSMGLVSGCGELRSNN